MRLPETVDSSLENRRQWRPIKFSRPGASCCRLARHLSSHTCVDAVPPHGHRLARPTVIANYESSMCVDNDDGSAYYKIHDNVCHGGGKKSDFAGHSKSTYNSLEIGPKKDACIKVQPSMDIVPESCTWPLLFFPPLFFRGRLSPLCGVYSTSLSSIVTSIRAMVPAPSTHTLTLGTRHHMENPPPLASPPPLLLLHRRHHTTLPPPTLV